MTTKTNGAGFTEEECARGGRASRGTLRGFAKMTPERRQEIASKGGRAAHASGKSHRFTSEEARAAGRKGGAGLRAAYAAARAAREGGTP